MCQQVLSSRSEPPVKASHHSTVGTLASTHSQHKACACCTCLVHMRTPTSRISERKEEATHTGCEWATTPRNCLECNKMEAIPVRMKHLWTTKPTPIQQQETQIMMEGIITTSKLKRNTFQMWLLERSDDFRCECASKLFLAQRSLFISLIPGPLIVIESPAPQAAMKSLKTKWSIDVCKGLLREFSDFSVSWLLQCVFSQTPSLVLHDEQSGEGHCFCFGNSC